MVKLVASVTNVQVTLIVAPKGERHAAETPVGADGAPCAPDWPPPGVPSGTAHGPAQAGAAQTKIPTTNTADIIHIRVRTVLSVRSIPAQLLQASVTGLVVGVDELAVASTPVSEGIEKKVFSQAAGVASVMEASLVRVATRGLFAWPLALTVRAVVRV
jgi:hypothetical protein